MTRLIISTNTREVPHHLASGHLFVVDLEQLAVIKMATGIEPPYRKFDHNPRGGTRGLRGMSFHNGELALANFSAIFFFDRHWNLVQTITHPSVSAIHEIFYSDDGIWVTASANDLLVRFDRQGNLLESDYMRSHRSLMLELGGPLRQNLSDKNIYQGSMEFRNRTYFKSDEYDRTHVNGIALMPDGRLMLSLGLIVGDLFAFMNDVKVLMIRLGVWKAFLTLNRYWRRLFGLKKQILSELVVQPVVGRSAIISGYPNKDWKIHLKLPVAHNPSHSPRLLENGTGVFLATSHGKLVHFDLRGHILSSTTVSERFLRGLLVLPNGQLVLGAGNTILIFDMQQKKVASELMLDVDEKLSVFDIQILPESFDLPPDSLEQKHGKILGFERNTIVWDR